jgi:hypothetical protein
VLSVKYFVQCDGGNPVKAYAESLTGSERVQYFHRVRLLASDPSEKCIAVEEMPPLHLLRLGKHLIFFLLEERNVILLYASNSETTSIPNAHSRAMEFLEIYRSSEE